MRESRILLDHLEIELMVVETNTWAQFKLLTGDEVVAIMHPGIPTTEGHLCTIVQSRFQGVCLKKVKGKGFTELVGYPITKDRITIFEKEVKDRIKEYKKVVKKEYPRIKKILDYL